LTELRRLTTLPIQAETDVVVCRQCAKQIAGWLGLPSLDQIRLATAVSELARNIYQYAGSGAFHFYLDRSPAGKVTAIMFEAVDQGPGITELPYILNGSYVSRTGMGVGLRGAQRLLEHWTIDTSPAGTRIRAGKAVHPPLPFPDDQQMDALRRILNNAGLADPFVALHEQGSELLLTTSELTSKQRELEATNLELETTNKGVVALYSELEKTAQELASASESKSRFFSNMTHEFRTPINIIENISKLLLNGTDGHLNAEQLKQVGFISAAAAELAEMVNELLDLAEAESGRMEVVASAFSLEAFVEQLRQFTAALALRYPKLSWDIIGLDHPVMLETDRNRLFQVMRNLISNAFKYTPEGSVTVRIFQPSEKSIEMVVEDTGVGISQENLGRIFEEFARVRMPGLTQVQGNGLGLPLAQRLAILLRGDIRVSSVPDRGSRFTVEIARRLHESEEEDLQSLTLEGLTVLIIDDNEGDRYLLRHLLEPYKPLIIEATTAGDSIDKLHAVRPDIIFLDLELPDIYGADLLESMDWAMHARVLINTAKPLAEAERLELAGQCAGVLLKGQPAYSDAVLRQLQRLTAGFRNAH
jgi:signal transduction histidine kinase/CheY-like chemotaxis protein